MKNNKGFALSMTVLWCIVFGSAMHSWTLGICMGLCVGIAFGLFDSEEEENIDMKKEKEK
ncbi:MAG: hypothetical protein IJI45_01605 [Anaerolineaceae bacterium]|nr:hypothetical protein [Oscillospiraceae bacterium]MBQ6479790.1 hypothetical protein [Anaerolineaceae bacterium]